MKKFLLSLLILSGIFSTTQAQETSFGLKAGLNYAYISGSDSKEINPSFQYHAGAIVKISFTEFFSIQPEFIFSVKGFEDDNYEVDLNYVDVPILLKVKFADVFSIHAGPQLSYLISSETKSSSSFDDFEEQINNFDLGVAAGFEYELASGFSLGARYSFSVESIGEDYKYESTDPNDPSKTIVENIEAPDYKNGLIQVFAAFSF